MFGKEITIMLYEIDQFNLDIANIKKDLEIEDIVVTEEQVATLKQYINQEGYRFPNSKFFSIG